MVTKDTQIKANIPSDNKSQFSQERYKFMLDADFEISNRCCNVMKKEPIHRYNKEHNAVGITAQMASESRLRTQQWLNNGCNGFEMKNPVSNAMAFWTESDVLMYCYLNNIKLADVYGEVVIDYEAMGQVDGQISMFQYNQAKLGLFDKERWILKTTKLQRSGCRWCALGIVPDNRFNKKNRFELLKENFPKEYHACFDGGRFEYDVKDYKGNDIKLKHVPYETLAKWCEENKDNKKYMITKRWQPYKGMGYKYIIDWINEHGNFNIRY